MPRVHDALVATAGVVTICAFPLFIHVAVVNAQVEAAAGLSGAVCAMLVAGFLGARIWLAIGFGFSAGMALASFQPQWLLYASPIAANLVLMLLFGRTLRRGRQPMISRFASLEQGVLDAELARYTRRLTWVWTVLFAFLAVTSAVLAALGSIELWSLFTNLVSYGLVVILFVGEFAWRHVRFPHMRHATPLQLVRLIRGSGILMRGR